MNDLAVVGVGIKIIVIMLFQWQRCEQFTSQYRKRY